MARIELPSMGPDGNPNWIEIRDKIKGGDIFAVHEASEIPLDEDGRTSSVSYEGLWDAQFAALAQRLITAWSFPAPVPAQNDFAAADVIIGDALDLDDYAALEEAVQPLMDKIAGRGQPDPKTRPTS